MSAGVLSYLRRHHWGLIATFIALGGTAYATTELPPDSVGTRQLQRNAVTLAKINRDVRKALQGRQGRAGRAGPTGPSDGYYSSSTLVITGFTPGQGASVTVPAGDYIATGGCTASQSNATGQDTSSLTFGIADAILSATPAGQTPTAPYPGEPGAFSSTSSVPDEGYSGFGHDGFAVQAGAASLSASGGFALPSGGTITETCQDGSEQAGGGGPGHSDVALSFSGYYVTAIKVATLHRGPIS
jgi:hypothetical protein